MRVIIAGSRNYHNYAAVKLAVNLSGFDITEIVSGHAAGVDSLGERFGAENNIPVSIFAAKWSEHGRAAGPFRNEQMSLYSHALILIWNNKSSGSANMKMNAEKRNLPIYEVIFNDTTLQD